MKTGKLNIVIVSGGTGSTEIIHSLKKYDTTKNAIEITSIINPYDDGASCGIIREQLNVIGPSDLRKNQWHQHKFSNTFPDKSIEEFCNNRYNLPKGKELEFVCDLLDLWDFEDTSYFKELTRYYFEKEKYEFDYKSINISNIIYGSMFATIGEEKTLEYFKKMFGNTDNVILNSLNNMKLMGITKSKKLLKNETPDIIQHNDATDPIEGIIFIPFDMYLLDKNNDEYFIHCDNNVFPKLNKQAHTAIINADLIIFAPGTQWSSLIQTYATSGFSESIKMAQAKKILLMNNIEDGDTVGQDSLYILDSVSKYLDLENIDIFINNNAHYKYSKGIGKEYKNSKIYYKNLGFIQDKFHHPNLVAYEILLHYYNINTPKLCLFDFDDTIYSRDDTNHITISNSNLNVLNELSWQCDCAVISGNDYDTIHKKLIKRYGTDLSNINFDIWADGGTVKYSNGKKVKSDKKYYIDKPHTVIELLYSAGITLSMIGMRGDWPKRNKNKLTCISIKPFEDISRNTISYFLNKYFEYTNINNIAIPMGRTSIDILNKKTNKKEVLNFDEYKNIPIENILYVGDELHDGNDKDISDVCRYKYNVKSPYETNILLNLMLEKIKWQKSK